MKDLEIDQIEMVSGGTVVDPIIPGYPYPTGTPPYNPFPSPYPSPYPYPFG